MRKESLHGLLCDFPDVDGFWTSEDPNQVETNIRSGFNNIEVPSDHKAAEALTQLGRLYGLSSRFGEASTLLETVRKYIAEADEKTRKRVEIRYLLEQGRLLCLSMMPAKAPHYFTQAWSLANDAGETFFAIDAALMLSVTQPTKLKHEWLEKASTLAINTNDEKSKKWLGPISVAQGWYNFDFRQYSEALRFFEAALDYSNDIDTRWCIARTLRALGRVQEALDMQIAIKLHFENLNKMNGHVFIEIAECYQLLQNTKEARFYFELAYDELSKDVWFASNKLSELDRMKHIYKKR